MLAGGPEFQGSFRGISDGEISLINSLKSLSYSAEASVVGLLLFATITGAG